MRNRLYDREVLRIHRASRPVISVGNLSVGGSGKTPLVQYLATLLKDRGFAPAILSRGYRGSAESSNLLVSDGSTVRCDASAAGDEPYLLARQLPGVAVAVGKRRWKSSQIVEEHCPARHRLFLLDDGFQHRGLERDLDLVVIDASSPPLADRLMPVGGLREPVSALRRADAIFLSRCHLAAARVDGLERQIRNLNLDLPVFRFGHRYRDYRNLETGSTAEIDDLVRAKVIALAALGNPRQFLDDLARAGLRVVNEFLFRDHHPYTQSELNVILERMERLGAEAVVTTEKDAVRLEGMDLGGRPFWAFRIEPFPLQEDVFLSWFEAQLRQFSTGRAGRESQA